MTTMISIAIALVFLPSLPAACTALGPLLATFGHCDPSAFGFEDWRQHKLHKGWVGLILCMMWEEAQGNQGKRITYLGSDEELQEPRNGCDKIGWDEAERDYHEKLTPAIKTRPDLFPFNQIDTWYPLHQYHITGSRILSRSFNVERWEGEDERDAKHVTAEDCNKDTQANVSVGSTMDVDDSGDGGEAVNEESSDRGSDDEEIEDTLDIAMVPVADALNARYDSHHLQMVTMKPIKAGEQIFNTYGDLSNSDLHRRYRHVDLVPCPHLKDLVVSVICGDVSTGETYQRQIDWWLNEGGDGVFMIDADPVLPAALTSFIRLLLLTQEESDKTQERKVSPLLRKIFEMRLTSYQSPDLEVDTKLLASESLTLKRHAIIVRLGEKQILADALETLRFMDVALSDE
ncbi:uncharacterized protein F5147DRAFT_800668 [Suillus discolor]|uniref:Rubisco LSMT substrate-binding domain-containing protein n=1 Tax=Suillus discolor TaxID=1912936 RepID=A0A9P7FH49_9AGAM|nr:uncharacterized protein F5147DRAFT_800668 [Suillus discolor]KAG2118660.1 hypothetical protein F5147DRAFT_800668 [Suillus discolor]